MKINSGGIYSAFKSALKMATLGAVLAACIVMTNGCVVATKFAANHGKMANKYFEPYKLDLTLNGKGWTNSIGDGTNVITVLYVDATNHYSAGYWHGKLLGKQAEAAFDDVVRGSERLIPKAIRKVSSEKTKRRMIMSTLSVAWKVMAPHVPRAELEEMHGLANGMRDAGVKNISTQTIFNFAALADLSETSCSLLVAKDKATADGHAWQLRILDYGTGLGLEKHPLITVAYPTKPEEKTIINVGWIGFMGLVSGMNGSGVGVSQMGYGNHPGETLDGLPMIFLLKKVLRYSNTADEAAAIIRAAERNNSYAYGIGDSKGGAIGLLTSARECEEYHANEYDVIRQGKSLLPQYHDVVYAGHYCKKQAKIVEKMQGKLCLETVQEMAEEIAMKSNLHVVIYDLTTKDIWVANRHGKIRAVDCTYIPFPHTEWEKSQNE